MGAANATGAGRTATHAGSIRWAVLSGIFTGVLALLTAALIALQFTDRHFSLSDALRDAWELLASITDTALFVVLYVSVPVLWAILTVRWWLARRSPHSRRYRLAIVALGLGGGIRCVGLARLRAPPRPVGLRLRFVARSGSQPRTLRHRSVGSCGCCRSPLSGRLRCRQRGDHAAGVASLDVAASRLMKRFTSREVRTCVAPNDPFGEPCAYCGTDERHLEDQGPAPKSPRTCHALRGKRRWRSVPIGHDPTWTRRHERLS